MRILHISKYYYPYVGGIENTCKQLTEFTTDIETAVVCFNEKRNDITEVVNGVKVYRVGSWINVSRQALSLTYFKVLYHALNEFNPDIIHFHWANPFAAFVLLMLMPKRIKLLVHYHMDIIKQAKIYHLIKPVEKRLLTRANKIIVTSPNYIKSSKPLQPFRNKISVVQSAMDERKFKITNVDKEKIEGLRRKYDNKPIVFFVGRHIQYKGLPWLLEAEKYVKADCIFVIAGGGPLTEELKRQCNSERVVFVGRLSDEELKWHHYAASVFAFPSITRNEAFGVALAEAMYCYTPTVTFTIEGSGVNWVNLNRVTGIEVPNKDSQAFAKAIDRLLTNKTLAKQYAEAGHQRVIDNFTIPKMMEKMNEVYDEIISM